MKGKRKRPTDVSQDDPTNISRQIIKGFNIAYPADAYNGPDTADKLRGADVSSEEKQAWRTPKHPTNPGAQLLDSYPLIPDWDAIPDTGAYMVYKFMAPPVSNPNDPTYDERVDVALLRPIGQSIKDQDLYQQEVEAQKLDPTLPVPIARHQFEYFLPPDRDEEKLRGIKRNFTTFDPDNEDEIPFDTGTDEDGRPRKFFKFENVRIYETANQVGDPEDPYGDVVGVALHDPDTHPNEPLRSTKLQKAAYFYPIVQRTSIRPRRPGQADMVEEMPKVDVIETAARAPEAEVDRREAVRKRFDIIEA